MSKENSVEKETVEVIKFYNKTRRTPKVVMCSKKPSKTQISPLDAKSPQELLEKHGMYVDRPALKDIQPFYADLSSFDSFEDSLNKVRDIKEKFLKLDVSIRAKFNHNPEEFCQYVNSKDFDIREILTSDMQKEYDFNKKEEKQRQEYEKYLKSDSYKKDLEEAAMRQKYEQDKYEEWKKNFNTTK